MGTKNVRKTKSYVTKEKKFKEILENVFSKIVSFFANISKLKPKQKTLTVNSVPLLVIYHH